MDKNRSLEFFVGFFIVLGAVALVFLSLQAANLGSFSFGNKTYEVTASFDNIGGLKPRAAIKSAGWSCEGYFLWLSDLPGSGVDGYGFALQLSYG